LLEHYDIPSKKATVFVSMDTLRRRKCGAFWSDELKWLLNYAARGASSGRPAAPNGAAKRPGLAARMPVTPSPLRKFERKESLARHSLPFSLSTAAPSTGSERKVLDELLAGLSRWQ